MTDQSLEDRILAFAHGHADQLTDAETFVLGRAAGIIAYVHAHQDTDLEPSDWPPGDAVPAAPEHDHGFLGRAAVHQREAAASTQDDDR